MVTSSNTMPDVDRAAASRAAVAARQARAKLKERLRSGDISPLRVLEKSRVPGSVEAGLRVTDYVMSFPAIGRVKCPKVLEQLGISPKKRLGGLGKMQRQRLEEFVADRYGVASRRAPLTVLAGPTAVGKGTVVEYVRQNYPEVQLSVSATTRDARPGEEHGVHYFFVNDEDFDRMLATDELLEWATVHGKHRYGTPRGPVLDAAKEGRSVLLEIDLQGARQVRASMPEARLVFLAPPSWEELERRLSGRGTESAEERERRLATARVELAAADEFDEIIINDEVPRAAERLVALMRGEL